MLLSCFAPKSIGFHEWQENEIYRIDVAPLGRMAITDKQTRSRINLKGDVTRIVSFFA